LKIENCPAGTEIRLFTVSGELVRRFECTGNRIVWDGKNMQAEDVAKGVYIYLMTTPQGEKLIGKIFLVR
jgi:hypothetical protein